MSASERIRTARARAAGPQPARFQVFAQPTVQVLDRDNYYRLVWERVPDVDDPDSRRRLLDQADAYAATLNVAAGPPASEQHPCRNCSAPAGTPCSHDLGCTDGDRRPLVEGCSCGQTGLCTRCVLAACEAGEL